MKKLFAVVAVAALALTSAVPVVQAAPTTTSIHKTAKPHVHKVTTKKKTTKPTNSKKKVSKAKPAAGTPKKA